MQVRYLYACILGLSNPWQDRDVQLDIKSDEVRLAVVAKSTALLACPECKQACPGYDT